MKGEEKITSMQRGTLVHKVLELIPFQEDVSEAVVKSFVSGLVENGRMEKREAMRIASFF